MEGLLNWFSGLPLWALYTAMGVLAAVENIFPPIPADSVVALGSFLAARGQGSAALAFVVTWMGNVVGAMAMYAAGRHLGADFFDRWVKRARATEAEEDRLLTLYQQYGLAALAVSRFIPGIRALVPPFAGAMRLSFLSVLLVVAIPSGIWYGIVTVVAFNIGTNLDQALETVRSAQLWVLAVAAVVIILLGVIVIRARGRRHAGRGDK